MALNSGYAYRAQVNGDAAGLCLSDYLARRYRHSAEIAWRERIRRGEVTLNGRIAGADDVLAPGDVVVWRRPPWEEPTVPTEFSVLYEDEHLLAAAKPAGLPTLPGGGFLDNTLARLVERIAPEAVPLHRLGRATSGIVLFARTPLARASLARAWRDCGVRKIYRSLVEGIPAEDQMTITVPIAPVAHPLLGTIHAACPGGKPASTRMRVLARGCESTLVELEIATGRPHQIRIHLAAAGHPLVGDPLYRRGGVPAPDSRALPGDPGYLLHAERLGFVHPASRRWIEIVCPPPVTLSLARCAPRYKLNPVAADRPVEPVLSVIRRSKARRLLHRRREGRIEMPESVYKLIELVGTSTESWEKAAAAAIEKASKSLRDLRIAEVSQLDMQIEDGHVRAFRAKVKVSFKYED
jgi:23S rRNA pseudouridine1911/1915/1917 synthase